MVATVMRQRFMSFHTFYDFVKFYYNCLGGYFIATLYVVFGE